MADGDTDHLRDVWRAYFRYVLSNRSGFAGTNVLKRIQDEGEGACIRQKADYLPVSGVPKRLVWVHRVYHNELDELTARVMLAMFGSTLPPDFKANALGLKRWKMYEIAGHGLLITKGFEP